MCQWRDVGTVAAHHVDLERAGNIEGTPFSGPAVVRVLVGFYPQAVGVLRGCLVTPRCLRTTSATNPGVSLRGEEYVAAQNDLGAFGDGDAEAGVGAAEYDAVKEAV